MLSTQAQLPGDNALVLFPEGHWVTETPTGLIFEEDTPLGVWGDLVERLIRQHKRLEWAIGDALQFGERRYGDTYTAWVEETGLSENTLATIKWVAGKVESSRRREDVGWSHHREVAALDDPAVQDRLLEEAADKGMTRWEVRQAVRAEQEKKRGTVADDPEPSPMPLSAADLTDFARQSMNQRAARIGQRGRAVYERAWVDALAWSGQQDCFVRPLEPGGE